MENGRRLASVAGWVITASVTLYLLRDISFDLQRAPSVVRANAGLGIPASAILPIGLTGLACALAYALPQTAMLGAILITGFVGAAAFVHLRVNGAIADIGENVLIGVLAWGGLWLRDPRLRRLLPIRRA